MFEDTTSETTTAPTSISEENFTSAISPTTTNIPSESSSLSKIQSAIQSLSSILTTIPPSLLSSQNPCVSLLHDPDVSSQISSLLRQSDSGAGDNNLCRWLYDTFQSSDPQLQLVVLRFLPLIAGLYLSRVALRKHLAGFEAILLALYAHETTSRAGQSITVNVPDLSHSSIYHESSKDSINNNANANATELNLTVISPSLEPHGTVRSTKRARIVGVALELYYSKVSVMPVESKIDLCEFCEVWSGHDGEQNVDKERAEGRIHLPWELLQPVLRILGHCLLGPHKDKVLFDAACSACTSLYARSMHDINPKAILATRSLLRLSKMALEPKDDIDYTEIRMTNVISL